LDAARKAAKRFDFSVTVPAMPRYLRIATVPFIHRIAAAFLCAFAILVFAAAPARAHEGGADRIEEVPAPTTQASPGYFARPQYIGNPYCYACHMDIANEFAKTKMGRRFLLDPQTDIERRGCEGCHGPGSNHAIVGGGAGVGGLIEFRIGRGQTIEAANRVCLDCHDEMFWHARTHGAQELACFDCHLVMEKLSARGQLMPPYVAPWNRRCRWAGAAILGLMAGLVAGFAAGWKRRRR
jgi:hypothetical protein